MVTQKGKGYEFAENNARIFHGISGFDVADGKIERANGNTSYTKASRRRWSSLRAEDERIVAITAAMPDGTGLAKFAEDVSRPVLRCRHRRGARGHVRGGACGRRAAARGGAVLDVPPARLRPDRARRLPAEPAGGVRHRPGGAGRRGRPHAPRRVRSVLPAAHPADWSSRRPKDTMELRDLLATALRHDGPMAIRYPRGGGPTAHLRRPMRSSLSGRGSAWSRAKMPRSSPWGPRCVRRGRSTYLADQGCRVEVINARFVKPLDEELIGGVLETRHTYRGGRG